MFVYNLILFFFSIFSNFICFKFNWTYFLIDGVYKNDLNYTIDENELIILSDLDYIFEITKLFSNLTSIDNKEMHLNDLLIWTFILNDLGPYKYFHLSSYPTSYNSSILASLFSADFENETMYDVDLKFGSGHCLGFTSELMKFTIARLLANKYFVRSNTTKQKILEIVSNVKNEFIDILTRNEWLDEKTRMVSLEKIIAMEIKVGYPEFIFDDTKLDELYADFQFGPDFFNNLLKLRSISYKENILLLMNPVDRLL